LDTWFINARTNVHLSGKYLDRIILRIVKWKLNVMRKDESIGVQTFFAMPQGDEIQS
jgi:hypothetical protein